MRNWRKVRRSNDRHARDWRVNRHQIPPCLYSVPAETTIALPFDLIPVILFASAPAEARARVE